MPGLSACVETGGIASSLCSRAYLPQPISISSATSKRFRTRACGGAFASQPGTCCWWRCWESSAAARACGIWNATPEGEGFAYATATTACSQRLWSLSSGGRLPIQPFATSSSTSMWPLSELRSATGQSPRSQMAQLISTS